jgi:nitrite reductase/ring-hydroxylating ferredoxin subunit
MVLRENERFYALHDRCSHRGCSLSTGEVDGDVIVCPCHGSRFALADGAIRQGPATAPQPAFEARVQNEQLELRRRT